MKNYQKNARIKNMQRVSKFDHFKMGEQKKMCIWLNLNLNLQFNRNTLHLNRICHKPVP